MRTAEAWLEIYAKTHQNPVNQRIHNICVPVIFWTAVAILWSLLPEILFFVVAAAVLFFYARLGVRHFLSMAGVMVVCYALTVQLAVMGLPVLTIAIVAFVIAWIGQFYGHKVEGAKPAFIDDLAFLLIGPLWVLRKTGLS